MGNAYVFNEQHKDALASYLKAEELDIDKSLAKSEGLYNNMAVNFYNLGQSDKALEYYTKEIEINLIIIWPTEIEPLDMQMT